MQIHEIILDQIVKQIGINLAGISYSTHNAGAYSGALLCIQLGEFDNSYFAFNVFEDKITFGTEKAIYFDIRNPEFGDGSALVNEVIEIIRKWANETSHIRMARTNWIEVVESWKSMKF